MIEQYGEATEENEMEFGIDVGMIISQLKIYNQMWFIRHMPEEGETQSGSKGICQRDHNTLGTNTRRMCRVLPIRGN
ncbi:hypothetical protein ACTND3_09210 [Bacillota bacterium HCP28S3_F12]